MNPETLCNFILANEQNLQIAAAVSENWVAARECIARGFLSTLRDVVLADLRGWDPKLGARFYEVRWQGISFFKPNWNGDYEVSLQFVNLGAQIQFGVNRTEKSHRGHPFCPKLLEAVRKVQPSASVSSSWWEARIWMQNPAENWREPDVLWRMHDDQSFLEEVKQQLVEVARAAESVLDRPIVN